MVLTAVDEDALETLREALEAYRAALEEEYRDYRPDELPKVENALLRTRGLQAVLVIAPDAEAAAAALDEAWK